MKAGRRGSLAAAGGPAPPGGVSGGERGGGVAHAAGDRRAAAGSALRDGSSWLTWSPPQRRSAGGAWVAGNRNRVARAGRVLPITLRGGPPAGGAVSVSGARSSQYASALLFLAPLSPMGWTPITDDLRSAPLLRATLRTLGRGRHPSRRATTCDVPVPGGQTYRRARICRSRRRALRRRAGLRRPRAGRAADATRSGLEGEETRAVIAALAAFGARLTLDHSARRTLTVSGRALHGTVIDGDAY